MIGLSKRLGKGSVASQAKRLAKGLLAQGPAASRTLAPASTRLIYTSTQSSVFTTSSSSSSAAAAIARGKLLSKKTLPAATTTIQRMHNHISASTDGRDIPEEVLDLPIDEYHEISDEFMENLLEQLETLSDEQPNLVNDVELSQGVMNIEVPGKGVYVINKQPPNKQIWLASPISGPNRFDYYKNEWVSLRDGSKLLEVLGNELETSLH
ncbi:Mitochondrial chaperone Frataxin [Kluyveromyces marxianus]|nr:Mitochondrial chaperone Frataxin [Kluyveromyces marxianus]KAG0682384.1 Mitochondrial chaperone Frataxin [Kluyveromyces marxianus]